MKSSSLKLILCFFLIVFFRHETTTAQSSIQYDIILEGGRVMDPETKLDAIRNVGILNNRIAMICSEPL